MGRWSRDKYLQYCSPTPKITLFGVLLLFLAGLARAVEILALCISQKLHINANVDFSNVIMLLLFFPAFVFIFAILECAVRSNRRNIKYIVRKRLCASSFGNPLHLRDGEMEPYIKVSRTVRGYKITVDCQSADYDDVAGLETVISGCLRNRFGNYAVVAKEEDIAGRYVDYYIEDVISNFYKQSVYSSLSDVPSTLIKVYIRKDVYIDYSRVLNSSAIIGGRSRSGKTTAIISTFLLPMLKQGRDDFGSRIIIVDPKSAELSLCPHVLSPEADGSVEHILNAIREIGCMELSEGMERRWQEILMFHSIWKQCSVSFHFPKKI